MDFTALGLFTLFTVFLPSCCAYRERDLRTALEPYVAALRQHHAQTGSCPASLEELRVPLPAGLVQNGDQLVGEGGQARFSRDKDGKTCEISYSGFSFCGVCRAESQRRDWGCFH